MYLFSYVTFVLLHAVLSANDVPRLLVSPTALAASFAMKKNNMLTEYRSFESEVGPVENACPIGVNLLPGLLAHSSL